MVDDDGEEEEEEEGSTKTNTRQGKQASSKHQADHGGPWRADEGRMSLRFELHPRPFFILLIWVKLLS